MKISASVISCIFGSIGIYKQNGNLLKMAMFANILRCFDDAVSFRSSLNSLFLGQKEWYDECAPIVYFLNLMISLDFFTILWKIKNMVSVLCLFLLLLLQNVMISLFVVCYTFLLEIQRMFFKTFVDTRTFEN